MIIHTIALLSSLVSTVNFSDYMREQGRLSALNPCIGERLFSKQLKPSAFTVLPGHPEKIKIGDRIYTHIRDGWCP
jgi:hypothetical protein